MTSATAPPFPFGTVVVTSPSFNSASPADTSSSSGPLSHLSSTLPAGVAVLGTSDPYGARCGSGGGTIAALDFADASHEGDDADDTPPSVLIVHAGGESSRCPTQMVLGKAWSSLPVAAPSSSATTAPTPQNPTALLVSELSTLLSDLPRGSVVVAASDVLLGLPSGISFHFDPEHSPSSSSGSSSSSSSSSSVIGLAVPAPLSTAKNHGVYVLEPYVDHVHDDDRLSWSEHDGGEEGSEDDKHTSTADKQPQCKTEPDRKTSPQQPIVKLRPRTVTQFLQKPSPDRMKATHHCTFGDDLNYEGVIIATSSDGCDEKKEAEEQECAWIDTGVVVFLPGAAAQLRALARGPLRCCTHRGLRAMLDEHCGITASTTCSSSRDMEEFAKNNTVKVELYTHLMLALSTAGAAADGVGGEQQRRRDLQAYVDEHTTSKISSELLTEIYTRLSTLPFRAAAVPAGRFVHLGTTSELLDFLVCGSCSSVAKSADDADVEEVVDAGCRSLGHKIGLRGRFNSFVLGMEPGNDFNVVLSSVLISTNPARAGRVGRGTVVEHSSIECPHIVIGDNCLVSGLRGTSAAPVLIPDGMCFQIMPLCPTWASSATGCVNVATDAAPGKDYVFMYLAVDDPIKAADRIYGIFIDRLLALTKLEESDLWDVSVEKSKRMLWNAQIHPVVRMEDSEMNPDFVALNLQPLQWIDSLSSLDQNDSALSEEVQASVDLWRSLPRLSLSEVRNLADPEAEFAFRASVNNGVADTKSSHLSTVKEVMLARKHVQTDFRYVVDSFASLRSTGGDVSEVLSCLDDVILTTMRDGEFDIAGRAFMVMGGLLSELAGTFATEVGAQVSVVTNQTQWQADIDALRFSKHSGSNQDKRINAFKNMIALRNQALSGSLCPDLFCFLAAIFEQAAFAFTEVCVRSSASASAATSSRRGSNLDEANGVGTSAANVPLEAGTWAVATAPARLDLQGGWSDTPPISYEHGGAVAGLAVRLDGKRPLSARCRIVASARGITLKSEGRDLKTGTTNSSEKVDSCELSKISDLADFRNPRSSCALLKCALIYLGLVPLVEVTPDNDDDLQPLINKFCQSCGEDVGLEIISTSLLPKGSGLGTSSILGGCVLASIERCVGTNAIGMGCASADEHIVDAVLLLEQLLTTGGGWQDQVNGLVGGLKIGSSAQVIPLQTSIRRIPLGPDTREALDRRIILAFTGQPRLAKNILVNVLRRWGQRTDEITKTVAELVAGAEEAANAAQASDIDKVGNCLDRYWSLKKTMAGLDSGVEPRVVSDVLQALKEHDAIVGGSLCGAGGGGFLALITRDGVDVEDIRNIVDDSIMKINEDVSLFSWHRATVDEKGLSVQVVETDLFDLRWHE